ncbi:MAG: TIGR03757 family integrating conjugative element protein [Candidatus Accumulibacter sp.]|jgi:integrating conjugative element protein (TIGR03757 family)|nr:TIGR03757 family integrating conjugative element protein [Accumulibacter sp.]
MPALFSRLLSVLFLAIGPLPAAAEVLVVTDSRHPIQVIAGARLIELDQPTRIKAELSAGLPTDLHRAADIARQRLREGGDTLQRRLHEAYQGVADARNLGVTKIPAVVADRRYVVYGESDVSRAIARIDAYRNARP